MTRKTINERIFHTTEELNYNDKALDIEDIIHFAKEIKSLEENPCNYDIIKPSHSDLIAVSNSIILSLSKFRLYDFYIRYFICNEGPDGNYGYDLDEDIPTSQILNLLEFALIIGTEFNSKFTFGYSIDTLLNCISKDCRKHGTIIQNRKMVETKLSNYMNKLFEIEIDPTEIFKYIIPGTLKGLAQFSNLICADSLIKVKISDLIELKHHEIQLVNRSAYDQLKELITTL